jgi:ABC-2 type transport system ATP-binding protein
MNDFLIETVGLRRAFGGHLAVDGLDLAVPRGSIFGFLGRNGAGKTTTIRLLLGFLRSGSGEARVFGEPVAGPDQMPKSESA